MELMSYGANVLGELMSRELMSKGELMSWGTNVLETRICISSSPPNDSRAVSFKYAQQDFYKLWEIAEF